MKINGKVRLSRPPKSRDHLSTPVGPVLPVLPVLAFVVTASTEYPGFAAVALDPHHYHLIMTAFRLAVNSVP